MLYEDLELMFKIQSNCSRISYVKEFLCTYFKHSGSTTTSFNNINLLDMIEAYRNAILNSNLKYTNEVSYNIAKRLLRYLNTEGLDVFKAEYIELIQELMPYFENNDYILSDNEVKKILSYSDEQIIPNMICYACFGNNKYNELNNWKIYTKNTHFVKLDEETCDLKLAPDFIKSAYKEGNYRFVGIYYGLKYIFYNGGMFFDERLKLSKPIGHLRDKNDFVLFDGKETGRLLMVGVKKSNKCVAVLMKVMRNSKFINDQFVLNGKLLNIIKDKINIKYKNNDYVL